MGDHPGRPRAVVIQVACVRYRPSGLVVKASALGAGGREFDSRPGQTKDLKIGNLAAARQAPDNRVQC